MVKSAPAGPHLTRAEQAQRTRRRLLESAVEVFADTEFDRAAVADIAGRAGVSNGLLFHYFGSKRGLYLAALQETAEQMATAFDGDMRSDSPADTLRTGLARHVRYLANHRGLALRLVLGGRGADAEAWAVFEAARWRAIAALSGALDVDPSSMAAQMVGRASAGAVDEAIIQWLHNPLSADEGVFVDWLVELVIAMVGTIDHLESEPTPTGTPPRVVSPGAERPVQ